MTKHTTSIKMLFTALCLLLLVGSAFAFAPSQNPASRTPTNTFTVAGQNRQCSEYADETGTFIGAKTITSQSYPALINIYYVTSTGWQYYNEFTAPLAFSGGNRQYAYEIYYCPQQATTCTSGQARAVTETTYQTCMAGQWGSTQQCAAGSYYSSQQKSCITYTCKEQWSCSTYGQCTEGGQAYRTCTDANRCGTFNDRPSTAQTCTPTISTGSTVQGVRSGIKIVGNPTADKYETTAGSPIIVTQEFEVYTPGQYWIEAGIEQYRGFAIIADVEQNTCNPNEPWYANELVTFTTTGRTTKTFQVTPTTNGEWILHTATVTGCGGAEVESRQASDRIFVGRPEETGGKSNPLSSNTPLTLGLFGLGLLTLSYFVWRRRR